MNKYQKAQKDRRDERKAGKRMERHKINLELKKVIDTKMDVDDVEDDLSTMSVYQNKNGEGWIKVEIPYQKQKI